jgi:hypothetical protein
MDLPEKRKLTYLWHSMGHSGLQEILHVSDEMMPLVVQDWNLLDHRFPGILCYLHCLLILGVSPLTRRSRALVLRRFC